MSRELKFLFTPPNDDVDLDSLDYEPFPAEGEPVYTTHPAFVYDESLKETFDQYCLLAALVASGGDRDKMSPDVARWINGEIPIPDENIEDMRQQRIEDLAEEGLPADTPIGHLKLAKMEKEQS